jgi:hypothetical protein
MKNADRPAMPVPGLHEDEDFNGLSKRERFAMAAMQGLLASGYFDDGRHRVADVTSEAIEHADALLASLERPT